MNVDLSSTFKDGRNRINIWKKRYSSDEYPYKVVLNIFYRKFTIEKMWNRVMSQSFPNWQTAFEANTDQYGRVAQMEIVPVLESWVQSNRQVGMLKYSDFQSYILEGAQGNSEALNRIEYTYLLHRIIDELIIIWISIVNTGVTHSEAIAKLTNALVNIPTFSSYSEIETTIDKLGAEKYLQSLLIMELNDQI
jgi:hypothetical protein